MIYRIAPYKAPHKDATGADFMRKENILSRQISRCPFKVGDDVWVQTKKGRKWGVIHDLIIDPKECKWQGNSQPLFLAVRVPVPQQDKTYASELIYAPIKKVRK